MTVTYSLECSTSTLATFLKLLLRWRGSIYKLMYKEAIIYLTLYTVLSLVYRHGLNEDQRVHFEKLSLFCERSLSFIPLTFILGFYVSMVVTRWWDVFMNIGWPDRIVLQVACYVQSADQKGRMVRRTVARYLNLAQTLVLRDISSAVKKRFPTIEMVIQSGFMNEEELKQYEEVKCLHHKYWIPIQWCCTLLCKARKESLIENDLLLNQMIDDIMNYRQNLMMLLNYDWISVPLVYTQCIICQLLDSLYNVYQYEVVTIAVYGFFAASLMARQYLNPSKNYPGHNVDLYVPIFTILQFVFYMGWLKVAESLINPLGEDDDDFEINYIVERNLQAGYLIADENYGRIPPLERDIHWNDVQAEIPHTAASIGLKDNPQIGSASAIEIKPEKAELAPSDGEETSKHEDGLSRFRKVSKALMENTRPLRHFLSSTGSHENVESPLSAARRKLSKQTARHNCHEDFSRSNSQRSSRRSFRRKASAAERSADGMRKISNYDNKHLDDRQKGLSREVSTSPSHNRLETITESLHRPDEDSSVDVASVAPENQEVRTMAMESQDNLSVQSPNAADSQMNLIESLHHSSALQSAFVNEALRLDEPDVEQMKAADQKMMRIIFDIRLFFSVWLPIYYCLCRFYMTLKKNAMKVLKKQIDSSGSGFFTFLAEEPEDMWHTYNLVQVGDNVRTSTTRKVTFDRLSGHSASKMQLVLTVEVEKIFYDKEDGALHVSGKNIEENQFVKLGAYHTLNLQLKRKFTVYKCKWDVVHMERISEACNSSSEADLAAVVMQDGLAHICLITNTMTISRAKITKSIPQKSRYNASQRQVAFKKFFEAVKAALLLNVNFDVVKCVLIASPGFLRDQFFAYLYSEDSSKNEVLLNNKSKFILVQSTTGHKHALKEILNNPAISAKLKDTKAAGETKALEAFHEMLLQDANRAFYGIKHVEHANELLSIKTLLISDALFRSMDFVKRSRYVSLVESVKKQGGEVKIFSSLHLSGEQLAYMGGVAAILRYPIEDLENDDEYIDDSVVEELTKKHDNKNNHS
ncbi:Protein pelota -like protein [Trichinella nativa]|uniref:Protein pelota-like protein n=1 Tax=Trichinella nativa TaxID=6335 RepID=A0A0V1LAP0_9BILA|nr:Protein pelota -like protein [Trichinella nativa]